MNKDELILVTGSAGFIGFSVSKKLLDDGYRVLGIDSLNEYYDVNLKYSRTDILKKYDKFTFVKMNLCDLSAVKALFKNYSIKRVCHLAAQAGVRYSISHPFEYQKANLEGFLHVIEESKNAKVLNFVYASSSSVYGKNEKLPFSEKDPVDNQISLYGATKRANELMAHTYSHLFGLNTIGLRFFTVYGPWGRPDMALFLFTEAILKDENIDVYNFGKMKRSFTYIEDIVSGIIKCLESDFRYEIFNLGNDEARNLMEYIEEIEKNLGKKAKKNMMEIQPGDVPETRADLEYVSEKIGFKPTTNIEVGIKNFIDWYKHYYNV